MPNIVTDGDALEAWRKAPGFAAIDAHPFYGAFGRRYYPAVFGARRSNESFAVVHNDRPVLLALCARGEGVLDWYGLPSGFFPGEGLAPDLVATATKTAFEHIAGLVERHGLAGVVVRDAAIAGVLSPIGEECLNRHYQPALRLSARAALGEGEAGLRRGLRKSFKSLLNWGQRNLAVAIVNRTNPDRDGFHSYQEFHRKIAGRATRPQASWDVMYDCIASGQGELVLALLASELVAATMVVDGDAVAFYASGVYDRDRFDKPLTHWPLWLAMLHAGERGMKQFDLGDVPLAGAASEKEINIGYFKRGFATGIVPWIEWHWKKNGGTEDAP
ncbi:MAG TPA: hypothetical protein VN832_08685 [Stellaceae bacterium]|nr:hypothetical protein [Stellaceae bacterium]